MGKRGMHVRHTPRPWRATFACLLCLLLAACSESHKPQASRETNWLRLCQADPECGELQCICGICTLECTGSSECGAGVRCLGDGTELVAGACGTPEMVPGLCAPECDRGEDCGADQDCVSGSCVPRALAPSARDASTPADAGAVIDAATAVDASSRDAAAP